MAANLTITTLGRVAVTRDNISLENLPHKAKALLIYLACTGEPQPRTKLVGLLWPEHGEKQAMTSLRVALTHLRKVVGPYLTITRQAVAMNPSRPCQVDLLALEEGLSLAQYQVAESDQPSISRLEEMSQALAYYQGDFLAGFMLNDSQAFEEWVTLERERLRMQVIAAMQSLVAGYMTVGRYQEGQAEALRLLQLDPLSEESHRQLMRLLAHSGQRSAALQQYETCRQILDEELGVKPTAQTVSLVEQIRNGELSYGLVEAANHSQESSSPFHSPPPSHSSSPTYQPPAVERAIFVGREDQITQLEHALEQTLAGHGQLHFVIGEAGAGKSALLNEFQVRIGQQTTPLIIASGACDAQTGSADPYLPFREMLTELAGSEIGSQLLQEYGPDLIDTLVPSSVLRNHAHVQGRASDAKTVEQSQIFAQTVQVLQTFAQHTPLLLILEDLHWVDDASMGLLFRLGRQLAGRRILMVGTYRSEEARLSQDGANHPLNKVVGELQNHLGDLHIDLDAARAAEGRTLVDALLDSEPNQLDAPFRQKLYEHTGGHPLFVVELLRDLQSDGGLVQDADGRWMVGPNLNWALLPARVEGIIGVRMDRLDAEERQLLTTASVLGEHFIAEVVAQALKIDGRQVAMQLSGALQKEHKLVHSEGIERVGRQRLTHYRFSHNLMQVYLYEQLDEVERSFLHEDVATVLEELYGEQAQEIAVELARHFELARLPERATAYLLLAGQQAVRVSAYQEALSRLNRGLSLLEDLSGTKETKQQELDLRVSLGVVLIATESWGASQVEQVYSRARELCRHVGDAWQHFHVLRALKAFYSHRAIWAMSLELTDELLNLARYADEPAFLVAANQEKGIYFYNTGEFIMARECLEQAMAHYDPQSANREGEVARESRAELDCLAWLARTLWDSGYPEQARSRTDEALNLNQERVDPFGLALHATMAAYLYLDLGEVEAAQEQVERAVAMIDKIDSSFLMAVVNHRKGLTLLQQGKAEKGLVLLQQSLKGGKASGTLILQQTIRVGLAEAYKQLGQIEIGLACVTEALAFAQQTGTLCDESTLYRLKGELIQKAEDVGIEHELIDSSPESCFLKAIEVARRQQAKSLELRATLSLVELWQQQDRGQGALHMLSEIYGWFTEGFETRDLRAAKALLDAAEGGRAEKSIAPLPSLMPESSQPRHNLPAQTTRFIGREQEVADLNALLEDPDGRLITIVGPGGMGKTRLALAVAEIQLTAKKPFAASSPNADETGHVFRFPHGIFFVSLAPLSSAEQIIPTIAEALGFQLDAGQQQARPPQQQIIDYLRYKQLLIVMDNFEHLLDSVDLITEISQRARHVCILVTSRERLHLHQEQIYTIQGLAFPNAETPEDVADYTALKLFTQSAKRVQHDFAIKACDPPHLTQICRLVEGLPLGLELAAAWVDLLSLADIATELQRSLDFLETDVRDIPTRHRSIRAVFDTSWQRMNATEREIFAQLSIFRGGFTREAAQSITGASLRLLRTLSSKSLLQCNQAQERYQIHELLRQYGVEKLDNQIARSVDVSTQESYAASTVHDRHSTYYAARLQQCETALKGAGQLDALNEFEDELENIRIAWDWAIGQGRLTQIQQALASLGYFHEWHGRYQEGKQVFRAAADKISALNCPLLLVRILTWQARFDRMLGQRAEAKQLLMHSLALLAKADLNAQDYGPERAAILRGLGDLAVDAGDGPMAKEHFEESVALFRTLGQSWEVGAVLLDLGDLVRDMSTINTAQQIQAQNKHSVELAQQALGIFRELDDQSGVANSLHCLGTTKFVQGNRSEALSIAEECIKICNKLDLRRHLINAANRAGMAHMGLGQYEQGQVHTANALRLSREIGDERQIQVALLYSGQIALAQKAYLEARSQIQEAVDICRKTAGNKELAHALCFLGYAERGLGDTTQAQMHLHETLLISIEMNYITALVFGVALGGLFHLDQGKIERAVSLDRLVLDFMPPLQTAPFYADIAGRYIDEVAATLPSEVVTFAEKRGKQLDFLETAKTLLAELSYSE